MSSTSSPFELRGRVAVITGGNRGIGRSIALGMARAGASIAVLARSEEKNSQVLAELKAIGVPAMALHLDVTARETLSGATAAVEAALGGIDILVKNAGAPRLCRVQQDDPGAYTCGSMGRGRRNCRCSCLSGICGREFHHWRHPAS